MHQNQVLKFEKQNYFLPLGGGDGDDPKWQQGRAVCVVLDMMQAAAE